MCPPKLAVLPSTLIMHGFEAVAYSQRAWNVVLAELASAFHAYALPINIRFGGRLIIAGAGGLPDSSAAGATHGRKFAGAVRKFYLVVVILMIDTVDKTCVVDISHRVSRFMLIFPLT